MSDRELELGLRAWYADEVRETETAPDVLRAAVKAIPVTAPAPLRPISRRRGMTLFAVAAVLVVGGALAVGSGLFRLDDTKPLPSNALVTEPSPSETRPETPVPTPNLRQGGLIAFTRMVDKPERKCSSPWSSASWVPTSQNQRTASP